MSWFNDYEDFIRTMLELKDMNLHAVDNVVSKEPFEKLRHWLYCSINNKPCDFDLSFIPNKKLVDKLVDSIKEVKEVPICWREREYFRTMKSRIIEFEDCFDNKPVRNIRWDVSLVDTNSEEVKALKSENETLKSENEALKSEIESLKAELAKKKEEEDSGWVMEICGAILRGEI